MRTLSFLVLFLGISLATRGETIQEWIDAAPKTAFPFIPWQGDFSTAQDRNGSTNLAQGFYGYLDLSGLSADSFPIQARLIMKQG